MSKRTIPTETIEKARALWNEGLPAREIGQRLGRSVNSVIGMAHRNGFPTRGSRPRPMTEGDRKRILALADAKPGFGIRRRVVPKQPERDGPAPASGAGGTRPSAVEPPTADSSPVHPRVIAAPLPAWISGAKPGCSWPIGEPGTPGFRYCDEPRAVRSYCAEHAAVAYRSPTETEARLVRVRRA
jgi:GcrA cell cycle regulator